MNDGLTCMNCNRPTSNEDGRLFAEVFVCSTCYLLAERLYMKLDGELKGMLLLLKDRIREFLVQGNFHYGESTPLEELSKKDLMQAMVTMKEQHGPGTRKVHVEVPGAGVHGGEDH